MMTDPIPDEIKDENGEVYFPDDKYDSVAWTEEPDEGPPVLRIVVRNRVTRAGTQTRRGRPPGKGPWSLWPEELDQPDAR